MARVGLKVIEDKPTRARYEPHMPRGKLAVLTDELMVAPTIREVVAILERASVPMKGDWRRYTKRLATGFQRIMRSSRVLDAPGSVFYHKGNTKLPFSSFSALPKHTCPGAGDCLKWCYSFKAWRYPGTWARQVQNTLLLKFRREVVAHHFHQLDDGIILRLYVDGDFDSVDTIGFWMGLLRERPDIQAYGYSKSWDELWTYALERQRVIADEPPFPANYKLNLSSGGRHAVTLEQMKGLEITRGQFLVIPTDYKPRRTKGGNIGFARYADPKYHDAVRRSAERLGLGKVFSCPGKCGECAGGKHACGSDKFRNVLIAIGCH